MGNISVKALFFDIDGTLMGYRTHQLHPTDIESLKKLHESGYKLFIASGRDLYIPGEINLN